MLVYVFHQSRFSGTSFAIYPIDVSIVSQPLDEIAPRSGINGILLRFFENPRTCSLVGFTYGLFSVTDRWKTKASKNQAVHNVVQSSVPAICHRKLLCTRDHRFLLHFQDLVNLIMNIDESEEEGLDVVAQGGIKGCKTLILQDREIVELLTVGKEFSEW
jgi:hypothetical protein